MNREVQRVYDKMTDYYIASGLSRSSAKVFAWLTVCEPAQQTAEQIQEATGVSAGGVSEATVMLGKVQIITRSKQPGERKYRYEILPTAFAVSIQQRIAMSIGARDLASDALEVLPDNERLQGMWQLYDLVAKHLIDAASEYK